MAVNTSNNLSLSNLNPSLRLPGTGVQTSTPMYGSNAFGSTPNPTSPYAAPIPNKPTAGTAGPLLSSGRNLLDTPQTKPTSSAQQPGLVSPSQPTQQSAPLTAPSTSGAASSMIGTYPGIVSNLINQSGSPYNQSAQSSIAGTQGAAQATYGQGSENAQNYSTQADLALKQLQNLQTGLATGIGKIETNPIPLEFQQGREQALQKMYGGQEQALASEIQGLGALYGTAAGQQGTGISGLNSAATTALSGQGTAQSALGAAGTLSQPQLGSIGQQQYYNPLSGQGITPEGGGGPFAGGVAQGQAAAGQQYVQMQQANTAAEGIQSTITNFLQQNPDINPAGLAASNAIQQWIQGKQLANPKYQTLFNYLSEYANTLAPILGVGGDPTNMKTQIAQSFINAQASGQSIQQVLTNMAQLASDKLQNLKSGATGGGVVAGGSSPGTPSGTASFAEHW